MRLPRGSAVVVNCPPARRLFDAPAYNETFLKHAAECELMAKSTRDRGSRATWMQMAERWHRLEEMEMSASLAAVNRKPAYSWEGLNDLAWSSSLSSHERPASTATTTNEATQMRGDVWRASKLKGLNV
jgi:hypothetical protein